MAWALRLPRLWLRARPAQLDEAGARWRATPPCTALATAGPSNLHIAVWLRGLAHLYEFTTTTLADLDVEQVETMVIGAAAKRPGH
ncbi:hypothetical protein [Dactylosporangium darangshiense]|uniref:Uncharacterized protein n=1 Tax=Dactylosporangium darangshiense TaxID=579108 RepID=A0ABP8DP45_9ACTN